MSRPLAALLGVVNLVPIAYLVFFFSVVLNRANPGHEKDYPLEWFFSMHIGVMVLNIALIIIYLVIAYRSQAVPNDKRSFWAVVIFMANMLAFPVFWYLYVWRRQSPQALKSGAL